MDVLKINIIKGTRDFPTDADADAFLTGKNFSRQKASWPWISDTKLVCARVVTGPRGYRIEYTTDPVAWRS